MLQDMRQIYHFLLHTNYRRIFPTMEATFGLASARQFPDEIYVMKGTGGISVMETTMNPVPDRPRGASNDESRGRTGTESAAAADDDDVDNRHSFVTEPPDYFILGGDESEFSYVIFLNNDYKGGGMQNMHSGVVVRPPAGSLVVFSSRNPHVLLPVTSGSTAQYIVTGSVRYSGPVMTPPRVPTAY
jgi:hypothetical protein